MDRMAMPVQTGNVIDYKNTGTEDIKCGDVVGCKTFCGIAETDIIPNEVGALAIVGVWDVPAVTGALEIGDHVYWNGDKATKTSTNNSPLGIVIEPKAANGTIARIKLKSWIPPAP